MAEAGATKEGLEQLFAGTLLWAVPVRCLPVGMVREIIAACAEKSLEALGLVDETAGDPDLTLPAARSLSVADLNYRTHRVLCQTGCQLRSVWILRPRGVVSGRRNEDLLPELLVPGTGGERRRRTLSPRRDRLCRISLGLFLAPRRGSASPARSLPDLGPEAHLPGVQLEEPPSRRFLAGDIGNEAGGVTWVRPSGRVLLPRRSAVPDELEGDEVPRAAGDRGEDSDLARRLGEGGPEEAAHDSRLE